MKFAKLMKQAWDEENIAEKRYAGSGSEKLQIAEK
jgi:hypothetical protein